jgi:hypothetical protein
MLQQKSHVWSLVYTLGLRTVHLLRRRGFVLGCQKHLL